MSRGRSRLFLLLTALDQSNLRSVLMARRSYAHVGHSLSSLGRAI